MHVSLYRLTKAGRLLDAYGGGRLTLSAGYVTPKQAKMWELRKNGMGESRIARELEVTRQTVHKAVNVANDGIFRALMETAEISRIRVKTVDPAKGILLGYSPEFDSSVIVTFSVRNGVQVWYKHEGDCKKCDQLEKCRRTILTEMEDRNIPPPEGAGSNLPSELAKRLFDKILEK